MSQEYNDDLFEDTKMTFGEHLEELRAALFKAIVGLTIGFIIGCIFANRVVEWIQTPVLSALEEYTIARARTELEAKHGKPLPPEIERMLESGYVPESSMLIEPFGLLERLKHDYPDQFIFEFTQNKFVPADVRMTEPIGGDPESLADELAARILDGDEEGPVEQELLSRISASQQVTLEEIADDDDAGDDEHRNLVAVLNELIEHDDLHKSEAFEAIEFTAPSILKTLRAQVDHSTASAVKELRTKRSDETEQFDQDDSRRLNRFLLAKHFEKQLNRPRVNVVDLPTWKPVVQRLQSLKAEEAFMIWLKAALVAGAVFSSPWIFWQIWNFVAAGLYPHERKYVYLYLPISLVLFLAGATLAFYYVFPPVLDFLFTFNLAMNIDPDPRIGEWLGFVLFLPIGFGISFQLPLVMLFLNRLGILSVQTYLEKWRIAVLVIFVISMILTPADPVSMLLMAIPLTGLYFAGVAMCQWMPRGRSPFDDAYDPVG